MFYYYIASQPASKPVSQPASKQAIQPASQPATQSVIRSLRQAARLLPGQQFGISSIEIPVVGTAGLEYSGGTSKALQLLCLPGVGEAECKTVIESSSEYKVIEVLVLGPLWAYVCVCMCTWLQQKLRNSLWKCE